MTGQSNTIGAKNVRQRLRFTRALLESKDLFMQFCFLCMCGSPGITSAPWKQPLSKDLQDLLFPHAGNQGSQEAGIASLLQARRGSQPACVWKPVFARNGLASPEGDLQICSEDRYSRGRVEVPDCPLPALQRHSQILAIFSMKEQALGIFHS